MKKTEKSERMEKSAGLHDGHDYISFAQSAMMPSAFRHAGVFADSGARTGEENDV